jgi:uncharacterized protein involved in exopolysaccharide biosynthesis
MANYNGNSNGNSLAKNAQNDELLYADLQKLAMGESENSVDIFDYVRALYKGKWIILTLFLISVLVGVYISTVQKNIYESVTTFILRKGSSNASVIVSFDAFGSTQNDKENEIQILRSRTLSEKAALKLVEAVYQNPADKRDTLEIIKAGDGSGMASIDEIAGRIRSGIDVRNSKLGSFMEVSFRALNPYEAAMVSRTMVAVYRDRTDVSSKNTAQSMREFLEEQLKDKRKILLESEDKMRRYMEENRVVSLGEESSRMIERYSEATAKMEDAKCT